MIGNQVKQVSGVIIPRVPEAALHQAWQNRQEARIDPKTTLVTDGQKFTITYRDTWQDQMLKHAFLMVVHQVGSLEADRVRRPKVETRIEWSESAILNRYFT
jgi:hypothetical protein